MRLQTGARRNGQVANQRAVGLVSVLLVASLAAGEARAQTPLLERYNAYFDAPFHQDTHRLLLDHQPGEPIPLPYIRKVLAPLYERRRMDRLRIQRVTHGYGEPTGFEDANGDGLVTALDLDALDSFLSQRIRSLGPYTDDELHLFRPIDSASMGERFRAVFDEGRERDRRCMELGCDADGDDVDDLEDLCPETADPFQDDQDGDGIGDACDLDDDQNGVSDALEACDREREAEIACFEVLREIRGSLDTLVNVAARNGIGVDSSVVDEILLVLDAAASLIASRRFLESGAVLRALAPLIEQLPTADAVSALQGWLAALTRHASEIGQSSVFTGGLCAIDEIHLSNNARVSVPRDAQVVAGDTLVLSNNASVEGAAIVGCETRLDNNAALTADIVTTGGVHLANNAVLSGAIVSPPCDTCVGAPLAGLCSLPAIDPVSVDPALLATSAEELAPFLGAGGITEESGIVLSNNVAAVLPAGTHFVRALSLSNNVTLSSEGRTVLVVLEGADISNNVELGGPDGNLGLVILGSTDVVVGNNTNLRADIRLTDASLLCVGNNSRIEGSLAAASIRASNNAELLVRGPMAADVCR